MAKKYLTGHVHRIANGALESLKPGDLAPDWVTNPALLTTTRDAEPESTEAAADTDGLDDAPIAELRRIATTEGVSKGGSKQALIERIRAHRATPDDDDEHAQLVARARRMGIDVDESMTTAEIELLIDMEG